MDITIQAVVGYEYCVGMMKLPISICVESSVPVEVAENIDINSVSLIKPGDADFFLGFSKSITSIHQNCIVIDQTHPYCKEVDIIEDEDEETRGELMPGEYQVRVDVTVFKKVGSGFTAEVLSKVMQLKIS